MQRKATKESSSRAGSSPSAVAAKSVRPKGKPESNIVQITSSGEFFTHGDPVLYLIGDPVKAPFVRERKAVSRTVNLRQCEVFRGVSWFMPCITHIECTQISGAGAGLLTTYACPTLLRPLEMLQLICQLDETRRELNGNDYASFMMKHGMSFSLTQVEGILSSPDMWGSLNLEGKANAFLVHQDGKPYFVLAYRCKSRRLWFVTDSLFLRGRGLNPDAFYHFRNPVPKVKR